MFFDLLKQFLEYRKITNQLIKELRFRYSPTCNSFFKKKKAFYSWLTVYSRLNNLTKKDLAASFYRLTKRQGIDNADYQLWLNCQPVVHVGNDYDHSVFSSISAENDRIMPEALPLIAEAFHKNLDLLLVYTDHDELDSLGKRSNPHFKPAWNLDLFFSINYLGTSVFVRRDWYISLNLPRDLALDDFLWLLIPHLKPLQILHLPIISYQHIINKNRSNNKKNVTPSQIAGADVYPGLIACSRRLCFPLPDKLPLITLIIPTRDQLNLLQACVNSILEKTIYPSYEIIIVDNQSERTETLSWFESIKNNSSKIKILNYNKPFNYSAINNFAVNYAKGSLIGLINNDIEVINGDWLEEMIRHALRPDIGCVGAKLYYPDGRIQHGGVLLGSGGGSGHAHRYYPKNSDGYMGRLKLVQNFTAVTGACLVMRKELYEIVGGLNEQDLTIAWSDIDLCLKVTQLGYRNLWTPYAELYHHESVSRGRDRTKKQRKRYAAEKAYMYKTWKELMHQDPCYNPNLTVIGEGFSLGLPHNICDS